MSLSLVLSRALALEAHLSPACVQYCGCGGGSLMETTEELEKETTDNLVYSRYSFDANTNQKVPCETKVEIPGVARYRFA